MAFRRFFAAATVAVGMAGAAQAQVQVTIENLQPDEGFFFTPVWLGFHDGGYDLFDSGAAASGGLELIAEEGDTSMLSGMFLAATNGDGTNRYDATFTSPSGIAGPPVFGPGDSETMTFNVTDPGSNQYLSLASMVIPSNDAFFGNGDPMAYQVFNADGSFAGPLTIEIFGSNIYDAGTESNTTMGAAFSAVGGTATDEGGTVALHAGLDNFVGTGTAVGVDITDALAGGELLARVTVVPEPSSIALVGLAALGGLALSHRRRAA